MAEIGPHRVWAPSSVSWTGEPIATDLVAPESAAVNATPAAGRPVTVVAAVPGRLVAGPRPPAGPGPGAVVDAVVETVAGDVVIDDVVIGDVVIGDVVPVATTDRRPWLVQAMAAAAMTAAIRR